MLLANLGYFYEIINGSGICCAGRRYNAERRKVCGFVLRDLFLQLKSVHLRGTRDRNAPQRLASQSQQTRGLVDRMMGLCRRVENWLRRTGRNSIFYRLRKAHRQGHGHGAEISFVASAGESAVEWPVPANTL